MQPPRQNPRISLPELKALMARKVGPERFKQYFHCLNTFLSLKLNKVEFNKLCLRIVGRENIPLHNQLIRSIFKNSCLAKFPPPAHEVEVSKSTRPVGNKEHSSNLYQQNGSCPATNLPSNRAAFSNGDMLPLSPKKARSGTRDRRFGNCRSALRPYGNTSFISQQLPKSQSGDFNVVLENGESTSPDFQTQTVARRRQGPKQHTEYEEELLDEHPAKLSTLSANDTISVHIKDQKELFSKTDGKEVSARRMLHPPLGIPFCVSSVGGACRALPVASSSKVVSSCNSGYLLDSATLREDMEQIATANGLEGVSVECANMLNNGLNDYVKCLIGSTLELVRAREGRGPAGHKPNKREELTKLVHGPHEHIPHRPISLLDFKVAMELNPQRLGEDWPLLLHKICTYEFDNEI